MQPYAVVEAYDVVSYVHYCFTVAGIVLLPDTLHFQVHKETLNNGIDAPMSSRRFRVLQVGQDKWVKLTNDVAL